MRKLVLVLLTAAVLLAGCGPSLEQKVHRACYGHGHNAYVHRINSYEFLVRCSDGSIEYAEG